MAEPNPELEALYRLKSEFELSPVWEHVREDVQKQHDIDVQLLLDGTEKDERVRGGIAMAKDILAIPDRIEAKIAELEGGQQ